VWLKCPKYREGCFSENSFWSLDAMELFIFPKFENKSSKTQKTLKKNLDIDIDVPYNVQNLDLKYLTF
jgi:hypothetical protein